MSGRVAGKFALVTGAAQGIGAAIASLLAKNGAQVLLTDINVDKVAEQARLINRECGADIAISMRHDVTQPTDWTAVIRRAREDLGGLSVLVNNAGIAKLGSVEDISLEDWRLGMAVNVDSVFLGVKAALPLMRMCQPGSIINISSIAGLIASHNFANYNATKAAVWMLTKSIALHCAHHGWSIRCNSVHPAFVTTPILKHLAPDKDDTWLEERLRKQIPMRRLGQTEDVANAVLYLASEESAFMTGAEIKLDGGVSAQ